MPGIVNHKLCTHSDEMERSDLMVAISHKEKREKELIRHH